jgi:uncharacterized protein YndB with AHSA1/START domain
VAAPIDRAFSVFTSKMSSWWPPTHKIGKADFAEAVIELTEGGRWYERDVDGSECDWGHVLAVEAPDRLLLTWQINADWGYDPDPAHGSEVEIRFTDLGNGQTRVEVEHRHLDRHGDHAAKVGAGVSSAGGWSALLDLYAATAAA